ncbi:MAG: hypothetical protein R3D88_07160 [Alphaproteobacteria bacterium]|nr:hypothetical protein [Alphaproteobacteria bacterium]
MFKASKPFAVVFFMAVSSPASALTIDMLSESEQKPCTGLSQKEMHGSAGLDWQRQIVDGRSTKARFCIVAQNPVLQENTPPDESYWKAPEPPGARTPNGQYIHSFE